MPGHFFRCASAALAQLCADNELCNSYMTFNTNYHDTGLWGVYAVADKDCAMDELAWAIMEVRGLLVLLRDGDMTCSALCEKNKSRVASRADTSVFLGTAGSNEAGV